MSKTLRWIAPPHHKLRESGQVISGGETITVSDERAAELLTHPREQFKPASGPLEQLTRAELDARAIELGLDPGDYRKKAEIAAAIEEAEAEQVIAENPPEARDGEGHDDNKED